MIQVTNGYVTLKIVKRELKEYLEKGYREIKKEVSKPKKEKSNNEQDSIESESKQG